MRTTSLDVLVLGAGIIGLSCARALRKQGLRVEVVEKGRPGGGASSAAAGMLAPLAEAPDRGALFDACREARDLWAAEVPEIEAESGCTVDYDSSGMILVGLDRAEADELENLRLSAERSGESAREIDRDALRQWVPDLSDSVRAAIHLPGEHRIDNARATAALAIACERAGITVHAHTEVESVDLAPHSVTVRGGGFVRSAGILVVAGGAWSSRIEGIPRLPVRPVKGQMMRLGGVDWPWTGTVRGAGLYAVRRAGRGLVIGATVEEAGFAAHPTPDGIAALLEANRRLFPGLGTARLEATWAGLRPGTPDDRPLIGPLDDPRLLVATGHYRNGILLAPWTAQRIVAAVTGDGPALEPAFLPSRVAKPAPLAPIAP